MTIEEQLKFHLENKRFCKVIRQVGDDRFEHSNGFIVDYSSDFLLMQDTGEFTVIGYLVIPLSTVSKIQYKSNEKYFDKIIRWEKQLENVVKKHDIDLSNWTSVFRSIKKAGFNVIIENERPGDETFDIGPILKTTKTAVYIRYFNASGYLDDEITKIPFDKITLVQFDNRYINVFSKYLRKRKQKER